MTTIKFGEKELNIKYGYEATVKSGIISKLMEMGNIGNDMESVDKVLLFVPELLLVGLQKFHKNEYGYSTQAEKEDCIEKVYGLLDDYFDEDGDLNTLFTTLQKELFDNGFLSKMVKQRKVVKEKTTKEAQESAEN